MGILMIIMKQSCEGEEGQKEKRVIHLKGTCQAEKAIPKTRKETFLVNIFEQQQEIMGHFPHFSWQPFLIVITSPYLPARSGDTAAAPLISGLVIKIFQESKKTASCALACIFQSPYGQR